MGKRITPFIKQCFVTATVCINITGYGCAVGFPAVLLPQLKDKDSSLPINKDAESWIASALALSLLTGHFCTPPLMGRLGRKVALYTLTIFSLAGWITAILATNVETLIVGRLLSGFAAGILIALRSALIGEYTSPVNRGAFLTMISLSQAFGIFFVHLLGSLISWQKTALICAFFHFIGLIMILYTPESPSWLLTRGRIDECREVFRWLRGDGEEKELEEMIDARIAFEKAAIKETRGENLFRKWTRIICLKEFYKPIILMNFCNSLIHVTGGTTISSYGTVIIGLLMGPKANAHFWMVFLDTQRIITNAAAVYVINRTKRRVMVFSTGGIALGSHLAIVGYLYLKMNGWQYDALWLPVLLINLQYLAVAVGMVPLPQVIAGEIFPLEYRSLGGTVSLVVSSGLMFLVLKTFPRLIDATGLHGTYLIYSTVIVIGLGVIWVMLPETKGKTLQEIEDELRGRPLRLEEIEARQSLQSNPIEIYKRKMSERRCSSPVAI